jgi:hypothetical protein
MPAPAAPPKVAPVKVPQPEMSASSNPPPIKGRNHLFIGCFMDHLPSPLQAQGAFHRLIGNWLKIASGKLRNIRRFFLWRENRK